MKKKIQLIAMTGDTLTEALHKKILDSGHEVVILDQKEEPHGRITFNEPHYIYPCIEEPARLEKYTPLTRKERRALERKNKKLWEKNR